MIAKAQPRAKSLTEWRKTTTRTPLRRGPVSKLEPIYLSIGETICEMRERLQISQAELGDCIGVTRAHICNIELGKSRLMIHQLPVIAKKLRIPVSDLLGVL